MTSKPNLKSVQMLKYTGNHAFDGIDLNKMFTFLLQPLMSYQGRELRIPAGHLTREIIGNDVRSKRVEVRGRGR
jgi:hypothetical protein